MLQSPDKRHCAGGGQCPPLVSKSQFSNVNSSTLFCGSLSRHKQQSNKSKRDIESCRRRRRRRRRHRRAHELPANQGLMYQQAELALVFHSVVLFEMRSSQAERVFVYKRVIIKGW